MIFVNDHLPCQLYFWDKDPADCWGIAFIARTKYERASDLMPVKHANEFISIQLHKTHVAGTRIKAKTQLRT